MADKKISQSIRKKVAFRANFRCEYCQTPQDHAPGFFEIEHIFPIGKGGTSSFDNLAFACDGCNNLKSDKTDGVDPSTGQSSALFHPRLDLWDQNFAWDMDFLNIIGISPKGRTTVELLQLNRQPLINLRRALFSIGIHPPSK
ncbi:MAG: HNH endonuclease signature motif containing protein [Saprospiraceae bacterium]